MRFFLTSFLSLSSSILFAQLKWVNADSLYQPLPASVHIYKTTDTLDGKSNIAFYIEARLKDKDLLFTADTSRDRRLTPTQFFEKNNHPLVVVNTSFFSYETNRSLNTVVIDGKLVGINRVYAKGKGADSVNHYYTFRGTIGINKKRNADVVWTWTDSARNKMAASQKPVQPRMPPIICCDLPEWKAEKYIRKDQRWYTRTFHSWHVKTAVGGGPVILQNGEIKITNEEELMFAGKAVNDKHPRTAMGYTADGRLIILAIQGRFPGIAEGATLTQEAQILKDLGCVEALNLDGGGSSCMLVNGKETIKPSDKPGQRPVPAVFIIKKIKNVN